MSPGDPELLPDPDYRSLLESLASRYEIETIKVSFGTNEFLFTRVVNPGEVPLDLDDNGDLKWQPYWAEDWESSRSLCHLLLSRPVSGQAVLDLGCGLGLTGAVASSLGAKVTLVDNAQPALEFSSLNCWRWRDLCRYSLVDWKKKESGLLTFDWIVGAEIIYDSEDWSDLELFWRKHLNPEGMVLLCDPFRRTGKEFRQWIQKKNWIPTFSEMEIPEFENPVNVIELKLPESE